LSSTSGSTHAGVSPADLALVRAARAWGGLDQADGPGSSASFWARFSPSYRDRLAGAWSVTAKLTPELAWQTLLSDQSASARFDPRRVHPSWFERILRAESPAVQSVVRRLASEPIRTALSRGRADGSAPMAASVPVAGSLQAEVVEWVLTLWAERLVGGVAESANDPPVILALARFAWRDLVRLAQVLGQIKYAFGVEAGGKAHAPDPSIARTTTAGQVRIGFFRRTIGRADPRLVPVARADFGSVAADPRRRYAVVGLITVARLLKACDAHRARWASQHIPYPVARLLGTLEGRDRLAASGLPPRAVRAWESWIFEAAWARLLSEGRLGAADTGAWT